MLQTKNKTKIKNKVEQEERQEQQNHNKKSDVNVLSNSNSDSDNDEGFVPTKVEINNDGKNNKGSIVNDQMIKGQRPSDWQPRYIFGEGVLIRKQPNEIYRRFKTYQQSWKYPPSNPYQHPINITPIEAASQTTQLTPSLTKTRIRCQLGGHAYKKFIQNDNYKLVYSKIKDKVCLISADSDDITNNEVNLTKVLGKYDRDHYNVIKPFDYDYQKNQKYKDKQNGKDKDKRDKNYVHKDKQINNTFRVKLHTHSQKHTFLSHNNIQSQTTNETLSPFHQTLEPSQPIHHHSFSHSAHTHIQHHPPLPPHSEKQFPDYINSQREIPQLQFDSKFQSGNLLYVFKNKFVQHYYLFLHNDTNSYGYNQWFYFSLKGMVPNLTYKFSIVNLRKKHSMFKQGMKISVFSLMQSQLEASQYHQNIPANTLNNDSCLQTNGWKRMGNNVKYQRSCIKKNGDKKYKFYCLTFELQFGHEGDYVKVAMNIPYSYSRLIYHMNILGQRAKYLGQNRQNQNGKKYSTKNKSVDNDHQLIDKKDQIKQEQLYWDVIPIAYSISNNAIPEITLTHIKNKPQQHTSSQLQPPLLQPPASQFEPLLLPPQIQSKTQDPPPPSQNKKKVIIILARQHPGETWSSFLMQQILYTLIQSESNSSESKGKEKKSILKWLLQNYIFKIIPMVNVDGVIYGNFRCDLAGFDLNRNWRNPDKNLHPQIFSIKSHIQKLAQKYQIDLVLDLHGHSKAYNTFSYSCKTDPITSRILSLLISQITPIYNFQSCTFGISKYKETTARAVLHKILGHQNVVTIENSFYGAKMFGKEEKTEKNDSEKVLEYSPEVLRELAGGILEGIGVFLMDGQQKAECKNKIEKNFQQYSSYERMRQIQAIDSGSQSQPFIDQISIKQKIKKILPKSFKALQCQLQQQQKQTHKKPKLQKSPQKFQPQKQLPTPLPKKQQKPQIQLFQQNESQTFIQRTSLTHYKRNSKQLTKKGQKIQKNVEESINSEKTSRQARISLENDNRVVRTRVGDIGLPFYIREKSTLVPIKLKNDSLEIFKDAYNATKGNFTQYESNLHRTTKQVQKKVKIMNNQQIQSREQFPLLCVLSEQKKRQSQLQKTHNNLTISQQEHSRNSTSLPPKVRIYVQNEKLQHLKKNNKGKNYMIGGVSSISDSNSIPNSNSNLNSNTNSNSNSNKQRSDNNMVENLAQKLKQKNSKDATLISKIWRQNFARYGKDLNVFFGGIRGN